MSAHATAQLVKQQIPLLDYLLSQAWRPTRRIARGRLMGLCPLHDDRKPSFLVDPGKSLFYCYGEHWWNGPTGPAKMAPSLAALNSPENSVVAELPTHRFCYRTEI